jgi:hypothetical protein
MVSAFSIFSNDFSSSIQSQLNALKTLIQEENTNALKI